MGVLGVVLFIVALLATTVGSVLFLVAAFRESTKWGLLVMFVPFAGLVFLVQHWSAAKNGFLISLAGGLLLPLGGFLMLGSFVTSTGDAFAQQMEAEMQRAMAEAQQQQQLQAAAPAAAPAPAPRQPVVENLPPVGAVAPAADAQASHPGVAATGGEAPSVAVPASVPLADLGAIAPADLRHHVGDPLLFVRSDGRRFRGELLEVRPRALQVERWVSSGKIVYWVDRDELREVRPLN
jgi:hypothetical protein